MERDVLIYSVDWKIFGRNRTSEKVVPFSRLGRFEMIKFAFQFIPFRIYCTRLSKSRSLSVSGFGVDPALSRFALTVALHAL